MMEISANPTVDRIRFVTLSTSVWGAETSLLTLAEAIRGLHPTLDLELVAPAGQLVDMWDESRLGASIRLPAEFSGLEGRLAIVKSQPKLARYLAALPKNAIAHSHHQWTHMPVAVSSRRQSVLDLHDFVPTKLGRLVQAAAVALAGQSYVASETVRNHLPKWLRHRTQNLNRPVAAPMKLMESRRNSPGESQLRVIIVCRPDPNKRMADAVLPLLRELRQDDELAIVGGLSQDYDFLDSTVKGDPRVKFLGRLRGHELDEVWGEANVHVLTAPTEPFGRVVVEAAMRGVPSIVHRGAGAATVVRQTRAGCIVDSWEHVGTALASLRDPVHFAAISGRLASLVSQYEPQTVAQRYLRLLP